MGNFGLAVSLAIAVIAVLFVSQSFKIVPQQHAFVLERLGRFHRVLQPGMNLIFPFIDRVAYRHSLKEVPYDVPAQICITKDNTQLQVDGILYFQVTDPRLASYGSANYVIAVSQLAQTTLRSVIGKMELDKTFEERDVMNASVVEALDAAAQNWGVKVLRYEIKDLTPPADILHAMQQQITAERSKRAVIAKSEGSRQEQVNLAEGDKTANISRSEGEKAATVNRAQGDKDAIVLRAQAEAESLKVKAEAEAMAIETVATATATSIRKIADAIQQPGGGDAVQLQVAERAIGAFGNLAQSSTTLVVPSSLAEVTGLIRSALAVLPDKTGATARSAASA